MGNELECVDIIIIQKGLDEVPLEMAEKVKHLVDYYKDEINDRLKVIALSFS